MYRPIYIKGTNWGPFESFDYQFKVGTSTTICGVNLTDSGSKSNESGKSWFFGAIPFALVGDPIRKVSKKDLVRRGQKEAYVEMFLKNDITNDTLLIKRTLPTRGSETISVLVNDIPKEYPSVNDYNKAIVDEIGISREDILNFFVVSKDKWKSFFSNSDSDKKDLIGRFSKADLIDGIDEDIQEDIAVQDNIIKEIDDNIKGIEYRCNQNDIEESRLTSRLETLEMNLSSKDEEVEFNRRKEDMKKSVNDKIASLIYEKDLIPSRIKRINDASDEDRSKISSLEKSIVELEDTLKSKRLELEEKSKVSFKEKYDEFSEDKKQLQDRKLKGQQFVRDVNTNVFSTRQAISDVESKIKGSITCPLCQGQFSPQNNLSIDELKANLQQNLSNLTSLSEKIKKYEAAIVDIDGKLKEYELKENEIAKQEAANRSVIRTLNDSIHSIEIRILDAKNGIKLANANIETAKTSIDRLEKSSKSIDDEIATYKAKIEEIDSSEYLDKSDLIKKEIDKTKEDIKALEGVKSKILKEKEEMLSKRKVAEDEIYELKTWILRFKQFYSHLTNRALSVVSHQMNVYLEKFGTDIRIDFDGFKTKSDGTISEKITPVIYRKNGIEEWAYGALSNGGRGRLEGASVLGFSTLINSSTGKGKGLDFVGIDEVLESIDGASLTNIIDSISGINKTVFIVTHVDIDDSFNKVIVTKKNDISSLTSY